MKLLFNSDSYKDVIKAKIKENIKHRGYRTDLAKAAGCQLAYLSSTLKNHTHLTPDQAAGVCSFWQWDELETEYFMNLVHYARAATPLLKKQLKKKLDLLRKVYDEERNPFRQPQLTDAERSVQYYSAWINSAVHMLLTIPKFQDAESLADHLRLPIKSVELILENLEKIGLARKQGSKWISLESLLHASNAFTNLHHNNWRALAISRMGSDTDEDFHYTGVTSLSHDDFMTLRSQIQDFLDQAHRKIAQSKEELGAVLMIDWLKY